MSESANGGVGDPTLKIRTERRGVPRWVKRTVAVLAGLAVGLAVAELIFWLRDGRGFPHVNFYVPDDELGVRLEPGAEMRLAFQDNPPGDIRVNSTGYRGAELPAPSRDEILVVGDSQVFGLGVGDDETFSAVLSELTGRPVVNAGVPTYGPLEYTAVVREMLESRTPRTVIYALNMANDWVELDRPNRARHAVWDGWAVRVETAPETVTLFPGRELLFRHSHLVYALRRWLWQWEARQLETVEPGPGDGLSASALADVVAIGESSRASHGAADDAHARAAVDRERRLDALAVALEVTEDQIDRTMFTSVDELSGGYGEDALRVRAARGSPGDIVRDEDVEEGSEIALTARLIRHAVVYRQRLEARELERGTGALGALVAQRRELTDRRESVRAEPVAHPFVASPLETRLAEVRALVEGAGAELVVLALPLDVQVSADEWRKYAPAEPVDMEPTLVLLEDLVATAERMGARALDATAALRAAGSGSFLDGDLHMTAKGHRAVAEALAAKLAEPAPLRRPDPGYAAGRSPVPDPDRWLRTPEAIVRGSSRAGCETVRFREWLRVSCVKQGARNVPTGVALVSGGRGEALALHTAEAATLVVPVLEGDEVVADFHWADRTQRLIARRPESGELEAWLEEPSPAREQPAPSALERRLCECHMEVAAEKVCEVVDGWPTGECELTCASAYGAPLPACERAYAEDCTSLLACVRGDPRAPPPCDPGEVNAGGTGHCFRSCDPAHPCPDGTRCEPWMGASICVPGGA